MHHAISERLKRYSSTTWCRTIEEPDGTVEGKRLTALERRLPPATTRLKQSEEMLSVVGMISTKKGIDLLVEHDVMSEVYYRTRQTNPPSVLKNG